MKPLRILETCLYASDLTAAEKFYGEVLGLELHSKQLNRHLFFRCGEGMLLIFNPTATKEAELSVGPSPIPGHGTTGEGHLAFAVSRTDLEAWRKRLAQYKLKIESEVSWPNGGRSVYFRDPANNSIEIASADIWAQKGGAYPIDEPAHS
ncbi:MAG: VOC family protein [Deltaproteobacteria bacterium]|nr:VOC family protein [Deltaproteobacteria bacterium]